MGALQAQVFPTCGITRLYGGDYGVAWLRGEHDASTVAAVAGALAEASAEGNPEVILDLSEVTFMGAATVGVIAVARKRLELQGRILTLRLPSVQALRTLELCGFGHLLESEVA